MAKCGYKGYVKTKSEYQEILRLLLGKSLDKDYDKYQKYRLIKKAENFILQDNILYLKSDDNMHKKVFAVDEEEEAMTKTLEDLHSTSHYSMNKMENMVNTLYFHIPRELVRKVVRNCQSCSQATRLKEKEVLKHVDAKEPFERIQIDLIDLSNYEKQNSGYKWIMSVIDIYSK